MLYQNRETGEILTEKAMKEQFRDDYDGGDPTNPLSIEEYYEEINDSLKNRIEAIAEEKGWKVEFGEQDNGKYAEFYQFSPAGEDFGFCVFYTDDGNLALEINDYYEEFDVDEHIEMIIEARKNGLAGVPNTRTLCKDAEDIDKMLEDLAEAVLEERRKWNELFPD